MELSTFSEIFDGLGAMIGDAAGIFTLNAKDQATEGTRTSNLQRLFEQAGAGTAPGRCQSTMPDIGQRIRRPLVPSVDLTDLKPLFCRRSRTGHPEKPPNGHGPVPGCFRPHTHTKPIPTKGPVFSVDFGVDRGPRVVVGAAELLDRAPRTVYRASSRWASTWTAASRTSQWAFNHTPQGASPAGSPGGSPSAGSPGQLDLPMNVLL